MRLPLTLKNFSRVRHSHEVRRGRAFPVTSSLIFVSVIIFSLSKYVACVAYDPSHGSLQSYGILSSVSVLPLVISFSVIINPHPSWGRNIKNGQEQPESSSPRLYPSILGISLFNKRLGEPADTKDEKHSSKSQKRKQLPSRISRQLSILAPALQTMGCLPKFFCGMNSKAPSESTSTLNDLAYLIRFAMVDDDSEESSGENKGKDGMSSDEDSSEKSSQERRQEQLFEHQAEEELIMDDPEYLSYMWKDMKQKLKSKFKDGKMDDKVFEQILADLEAEKKGTFKLPSLLSGIGSIGSGIKSLVRFGRSVSSAEPSFRQKRAFWDTEEFDQQMTLAARIGKTSGQDDQKCTTTFNLCPYTMYQMKGMVSGRVPIPSGQENFYDNTKGPPPTPKQSTEETSKAPVRHKPPNLSKKPNNQLSHAVYEFNPNSAWGRRPTPRPKRPLPSPVVPTLGSNHPLRPESDDDEVAYDNHALDYAAEVKLIKLSEAMNDNQKGQKYKPHAQQQKKKPSKPKNKVEQDEESTELESSEEDKTPAPVKVKKKLPHIPVGLPRPKYRLKGKLEQQGLRKPRPKKNKGKKQPAKNKDDEEEDDVDEVSQEEEDSVENDEEGGDEKFQRGDKNKSKFRPTTAEESLESEEKKKDVKSSEETNSSEEGGRRKDGGRRPGHDGEYQEYEYSHEATPGPHVSFRPVSYSYFKNKPPPTSALPPPTRERDENAPSDSPPPPPPPSKKPGFFSSIFGAGKKRPAQQPPPPPSQGPTRDQSDRDDADDESRSEEDNRERPSGPPPPPPTNEGPPRNPEPQNYHPQHRPPPHNNRPPPQNHNHPSEDNNRPPPPQNRPPPPQNRPPPPQNRPPLPQDRPFPLRNRPGPNNRPPPSQNQRHPPPPQNGPPPPSNDLQSGPNSYSNHPDDHERPDRPPFSNEMSHNSNRPPPDQSNHPSNRPPPPHSPPQHNNGPHFLPPFRPLPPQDPHNHQFNDERRPPPGIPPPAAPDSPDDDNYFKSPTQERRDSQNSPKQDNSDEESKEEEEQEEDKSVSEESKESEEVAKDKIRVKEIFSKGSIASLGSDKATSTLDEGFPSEIPPPPPIANWRPPETTPSSGAVNSTRKTSVVKANPGNKKHHSSVEIEDYEVHVLSSDEDDSRENKQSDEDKSSEEEQRKKQVYLPEDGHFKAEDDEADNPEPPKENLANVRVPELGNVVKTPSVGVGGDDAPNYYPPLAPASSFLDPQKEIKIPMKNPSELNTEASKCVSTRRKPCPKQPSNTIGENPSEKNPTAGTKTGPGGGIPGGGLPGSIPGTEALMGLNSQGQGGGSPGGGGQSGGSNNNGNGGAGNDNSSEEKNSSEEEIGERSSEENEKSSEEEDYDEEENSKRGRTSLAKLKVKKPLPTSATNKVQVKSNSTNIPPTIGGNTENQPDKKISELDKLGLPKTPPLPPIYKWINRPIVAYPRRKPHLSKPISTKKPVIKRTVRPTKDTFYNKPLSPKIVQYLRETYGGVVKIPDRVRDIKSPPTSTTTPTPKKLSRKEERSTKKPMKYSWRHSYEDEDEMDQVGRKSSEEIDFDELHSEDEDEGEINIAKLGKRQGESATNKSSKISNANNKDTAAETTLPPIYGKKHFKG